MALPFLKYAGGKRALLPQIKELMPATFRRYLEPFLGGGAVFFNLEDEAENAWINDVNASIIDIYRGLSSDVEAVISDLKSLAYAYAKDGTSTYSEMRKEFNSKDALLTLTEHAALGIFLNKTCFNGLWRTNSQGLFNVPCGNYTNPQICDEDRLRAAAKALRTATIRCGSFFEVEKEACEGDFVYFDPPYVPTSSTSNFTAYARGGFSFKDHEALADLAKRLKDRGVHVLLSNSYTPQTLKLYTECGFEIFEVECGRAINSKAAGRGLVKELLVK